MDRVYLDHNATSPMRPQAAEAMIRALEIGGNPSSVHARGRTARAVVEDGRAVVAAMFGADPSDVIFASGGTEANALGIRGADGIGRLIVGATEHESVARTARSTGLPVEVWPVDAQGVADLDWLRKRLARWTAAEGRPLVALMLANNETGVIQPVTDAAVLVHEAGGRLHVDAVQAAGKVGVDVKALGADTLAVSAHKLGGPQGIGALVLGAGGEVRPQSHGGAQERGLRAGTENVAGVAGFAGAVQAAMNGLAGAAAQAVHRDRAAERLVAEAGVQVAGAGAARLPGTLCIAARDLPSALQVMALDLEGVMVSAGSACSSGKVTRSQVLDVMGFGELALGGLRASGGWNTTSVDWERFADVWLGVHARRRSRVRERELA